ncbi:hypothetical protein GCM10023334_045110 [Nonomuraea thailandensis]
MRKTGGTVESGRDIVGDFAGGVVFQIPPRRAALPRAGDRRCEAGDGFAFGRIESLARRL